MSCNGCRVLRRGCGESCILRPCLQWIENPKAQANATLFVSKFFGRSDLMSFIAAVPDNLRPALFQSLLLEACGRTVNPVNGAVGLLLTGNWRICEAAVQTVLAGGNLRPVAAGILTPEYDEASEAFRSESLKLRKWDSDFNDNDELNFPAKKEQKVVPISFNSKESEMMVDYEGGDCGVEKLREEEPKLLNLFV